MSVEVTQGEIAEVTVTDLDGDKITVSENGVGDLELIATSATRFIEVLLTKQDAIDFGRALVKFGEQL